MKKTKQGSFKIERQFGKSITDEEGKQVAWVEDYNLAKEVCTFLNRNRSTSLYPEHVRIGGDCYVLDDDAYYSHRLNLRVDFTVIGDNIYTASKNTTRNGIVIRRCSKESWKLDNKDCLS